MRMIDLGAEVDYRDAWRLQQVLHADVVAGADPVVLLLEHASVYTAGSGTRPEHVPPGVDAIPVDRGGSVTWHGPGQLVAYPIVPIAPLKVVDWVRVLEEAIIRAFADYGVEAARVVGRSGVWIPGAGGPDRKLAQVGIRVRDGVSMHGVAVNLSCDLGAFGAIIPCGITDAEVTTLQRESGAAPSVPEFGRAFAARLADVLAERGVGAKALEVAA